jgi:hypothetical protein
LANEKATPFGNDTIDPYPLIPGEVTKILCITSKTYAEISQAYRAFRSFIKRPAPRKAAEPGYQPKPKSTVLAANHQRDYEPTNAIYCNDSDWRRWVRVKEWFNEYGPDAEIFKRTSLIE